MRGSFHLALCLCVGNFQAQAQLASIDTVINVPKLEVMTVTGHDGRATNIYVERLPDGALNRNLTLKEDGTFSGFKDPRTEYLIYQSYLAWENAPARVQAFVKNYRKNLETAIPARVATNIGGLHSSPYKNVSLSRPTTEGDASYFKNPVKSKVELMKDSINGGYGPTFCQLTYLEDVTKTGNAWGDMKKECDTVGGVTVTIEDKVSRKEIVEYLGDKKRKTHHLGNGLVDEHGPVYTVHTPNFSHKVGLQSYAPMLSKVDTINHYGGLSNGKLKTTLMVLHTSGQYGPVHPQLKQGERIETVLYLQVGDTPEQTCVVAAKRRRPSNEAVLAAGYPVDEFRGNGSVRLRRVFGGVDFKGEEDLKDHFLNNPVDCTKVDVAKIREDAVREPRFAAARRGQPLFDEHFGPADLRRGALP